MTAEQLKNSILQEAISGRLVPQDPNDEPAEIVSTVPEDEVPFEIPASWRWIRMKDCAAIIGGYAFPSASIKGEKGVRVIRISDISEKGFVNKSVVRYNGHENLNKFKIIPQDILIAMTGGTVGKSLFVQQMEEDMLLNQRVAIIRNNGQYAPYIDIVVKSPHIKSFINDKKNSTNDNISMGDINSFLVPLPPIAEQKRIVAKLEELLPIVEQYGKAQEELDELNAALPARLRQSILQEAIHGKLVQQDEKEGTAEELLKLIDAEKQRLVKERILKKAIRTSAIIPEDSPFEIPTSWLWANLEDVTYAVGGRENQILSKEILKEGKIRVVSQGQAIYDGYCNDATKEINDLPVILFGDHTRNVKYIDFPFVIGADGTKLFRPIGIYPRYLYYWMKYAASTLRNRGYARHYTLLKVVPVPLPPLAEQQRIVAKIEELFEQINNISK